MGIVICEHCGKEFKKFDSEIKRSKHNYCCNECYRTAIKVETKIIKCKYCGKEFISKSNRNNYYCSQQCYEKYRALKNINVKCVICGKEFKKNINTIMNNCYCSQECYNKSKLKQNNIIIKNDYAEIIINDKKILIDIEDVEKIQNYHWYIDSTGYVVAQERKIHKLRKKFRIHRIITNCPDNMVVDHINHNKLDNRKCNLYVCIQKENSQNKFKNNDNNKSCGIRGVTWNKKKKKWNAYVYNDYKRINIGYFENIEQAKNAVIEARNKYHTHNIYDRGFNNVK